MQAALLVATDTAHPFADVVVEEGARERETDDGKRGARQEEGEGHQPHHLRLAVWLRPFCRIRIRVPAIPHGSLRRPKELRPGATTYLALEPQQLKLAIDLLRDRKSTRLNSSHSGESRMPSSA